MRYAFLCGYMLLLALCGGSLVAQEQYQGRVKGVKVFAVADVSCESSLTCNSFLKVISRSSGFPIDQARYAIYYDFSYTLSGSTLDLVVTLDSIRGTTVYRGFDLSGSLLPSSINLRWDYVGNNGVTIPGDWREVFREEDRPAYALKVSLSGGIHPDSLRLAALHFIYREADFEEFDALSRVIQDYYAASDISDTLLRRMGVMDPRDSSTLASFYLHYLDYRRVAQRLVEASFPDHLPASGTDPADYAGDMRRLSGRLNSLKWNLERTLRESAPTCPDATRLSEAFFNQSLFWFDLAGKVDYHYKNLVYDLGRLDDRFSVVDSFAVAYRMAYTDFYRVVCARAAQLFLTEAEHRLSQENYTHAIALGENAAFYALRGDTLSEEVQSLLGRSWRGLYDSYLLISRRTIAIGNYEFAEQYLNEAFEIYLNSGGFLNAYGEVHTLFEHLYQALFDQGLMVKRRYSSQEALYFFYEAARIDALYLDREYAVSVKRQIDALEHGAGASWLGGAALDDGAHEGKAYRYAVANRQKALQERVHRCRCDSLKINFRRKMWQLKQCFGTHDYAAGVALFDEMPMAQAARCGLEISAVHALQKKYQPYLDYYHHLDSCRLSLEKGREEEAAKHYLWVARAVREIHLENPSFQQVGVAELLATQQRETLSIGMADALSYEAPHLAVDLLHVAASRKLAIPRKLLIKIGLRMGEYDMAHQWVRTGSFYAKGNRRLNPLKRAYNARIRSRSNPFCRALVNYYEGKN